MNNVLHKINGIDPLGETALRLLTDLLKQVSYPRRHQLFRAGEIVSSVFFLEKGIARGYYEQEDQEITLCFGLEGDILFSHNSYVYHAPGYESMELLEDSILYELDVNSLQVLFQEHTALANWGRKLAEQELIKAEGRFMGRLFRSAADRYAELMATTPELLQRIQLGYIASYLGITQVTLSKIRAKR